MPSGLAVAPLGHTGLGRRTDGIAADNRRDGMIDTLIALGGNSMRLTMLTDVHGISF
jgi:hypothetical protein